MSTRYVPKEVESRWQAVWREESGRVTEEKEEDGKREKFYVLSMFPYPSGRLHMGHVRVYSISNTLAHFHRMRGRKVGVV